MLEQELVGVFQLDNGYWGYRYAIVINGKITEKKKLRNELGQPFKTAKQATKERRIAIAKAQAAMQMPQKKELIRRTVQEVY